MLPQESATDSVPSKLHRTRFGVPIWGLLLVLIAGVVPSLGTFGAGLISDDGAALGYVHRAGAFADWFGPEYDMRMIRFWRPLVTVSIGLQESMTGVSPMPLRLFNLACHLCMALLAVGVSRRLRVPVLGAILVGVGVAFFPYQGGTVTWMVGRVDAQCVPLVLAAIYFALGRRFWLGSLFCFLAVATKETAFVTPPVIILLVTAKWLGDSKEQRPSLGSELLALWPILVTFAGTLVWRRLALGTWAGGYPGGLALAFPVGPDGSGGVTFGALLGQVESAVRSLGWALALPVLGGLGVIGNGVVRGWSQEGRRGLWLIVAGVVCAFGSTAPMVTLLAQGPIADEHERTLLLADTMLLLSAGGLFIGFARAHAMVRYLPALLLVTLIGQRSYVAWIDTHDWAMAGDMAHMLVTQTAQVVQDEQPSDKPVLSSTPPRTLNRAYVLLWGVADRFRAPFPETPRPIWPWRPIWDGPEMARDSVTTPRNHLRWEFGEAKRNVPLLPVVRGEANASVEPVTELKLTENLLTEEGPILRIEGSFPGARFEALIFTELGYAIGLHGGPKQYGPMEALPNREAGEKESQVPAPFGGLISLRQLLMMRPMGEGTPGVALWEAIALAADLGAREAYLELRASDDGRGKKDRVVGASQWIKLTWDKSLRDVLLPMDSF